jgi:hypothetical protein
VIKMLALAGLLVASVTTQTAAQEGDRKYVVGIRSALITGTMELSGLDPAFGDLSPDGLVGPHMSGFFFLIRVRPNLRMGIETLVSNSDQTAATTMNYQAAGPVIELSYGKSWFVSGGVHLGGLIVNAMSREGSEPAQGATAGSYYKGNGFFVAPSADVGRRFGRSEAGLFAKRVNIFGERERGAISAFSSTFVGLRFAVGM